MNFYISKYYLKNIFIILFIFQIFYTYGQKTNSNDMHYSVSPFSELIASRIYSIARLKQIMIFLHKSYTQNILSNVQEHINEELFYEWKQFSQFQKLNEEDFQINFVKKVFKILYLILEENKALYTQFKLHTMIATQQIDCNEKQYCDAISAMFDFIKIRIVPTLKKNMVLEKNNLDSPIGVDGFTLHFYKIRRLTLAKKILLKSNIEITPQQPTKLKNPLQELINLISHDSIKQTLLKMIQTKKITPLFDLWDEFEQFKYTNDTRFFQEMLMTIFTTYKKILMQTIIGTTQHNNISRELETILALYENIEQLSEEELLASIDRTTDYLREILATIKKKPTILSQLQQWWIPTGALASIVLYLIMRPS